MSEVLRFSSSSATDIYPVFEIIGDRAEKLCNAEISVVSVGADRICLASINGVSDEGVDACAAHFPCAWMKRLSRLAPFEPKQSVIFRMFLMIYGIKQTDCSGERLSRLSRSADDP